MKQIANKKIIVSLLLSISLLTASCPPAANAMKYIGSDKKGAKIYNCGFTCGNFKVIKIAKNTFRVYSIPFSGVMKANSFDEAARKACEAGGRKIEKMEEANPSRNGNGC